MGEVMWKLGCDGQQIPVQPELVLIVYEPILPPQHIQDLLAFPPPPFKLSEGDGFAKRSCGKSREPSQLDPWLVHWTAAALSLSQPTQKAEQPSCKSGLLASSMNLSSAGVGQQPPDMRG